MISAHTACPSSEKRDRLASILHDCQSVVVGYSGGVDSVFLARLAVDLLGRGQVLAVTGLSAAVPAWGREMARDVAHRFDIPWREVETLEGADPRYAANPSNRCYFCKDELWKRLSVVAREMGFRTVVDGANADDARDHRPGGIAARQHGVRSPLLEAGLTKAEIRSWSRELELPTWDQPAAPCLASRLPYGLAVTPERLAAVEAAETGLRALGLRQFRVRHHGDVARIEASEEDRARLAEHSKEAAARVRSAGFSAVLLDLEGYRRGALNEGLAAAQLITLGS